MRLTSGQIDTIEKLYNKAKNGWTGCHWDEYIGETRLNIRGKTADGLCRLATLYHYMKTIPVDKRSTCLYALGHEIGKYSGYVIVNNKLDMPISTFLIERYDDCKEGERRLLEIEAAIREANDLGFRAVKAARQYNMARASGLARDVSNIESKYSCGKSRHWEPLATYLEWLWLNISEAREEENYSQVAIHDYIDASHKHLYALQRVYNILAVYIDNPLVNRIVTHLGFGLPTDEKGITFARLQERAKQVARAREMVFNLHIER